MNIYSSSIRRQRLWTAAVSDRLSLSPQESARRSGILAWSVRVWAVDMLGGRQSLPDGADGQGRDANGSRAGRRQQEEAAAWRAPSAGLWAERTRRRALSRRAGGGRPLHRDPPSSRRAAPRARCRSAGPPARSGSDRPWPAGHGPSVLDPTRGPAAARFATRGPRAAGAEARSRQAAPRPARAPGTPAASHGNDADSRSLSRASSAQSSMTTSKSIDGPRRQECRRSRSARETVRPGREPCPARVEGPGHHPSHSRSRQAQAHPAGRRPRGTIPLDAVLPLLRALRPSRWRQPVRRVEVESPTPAG